MLAALCGYVGIFVLGALLYCGSSTCFGAEQISLDANSVIGGSGAWDVVSYLSGSYSAAHVVDGQSGGISEAAPGSFWLGRENTSSYAPYPNEYFVLDLGSDYEIEQIDLFNTHNQVYGDRATKNFIVYASNFVSDGLPGAGKDLVSPVQVLGGALSFQARANDPIEAEVFTSANGLAAGVPYRYLKFVAVDTFTPIGDGGFRGTGLNEIRVFGSVPPASIPTTLSGLNLGTTKIQPAFNSGTTTYSASALYTSSSITVTPTATDSRATVTVNGAEVSSGSTSASIPLAVGENTVSIVVSAPGSEPTTYAVTLHRMAENVLDAVFRAPGEVGVSLPGFSAEGYTLNLSLEYYPDTGTNLTVVDNAGSGFIGGQFFNLAQNQPVDLVVWNRKYSFVANYFGGTGNDLVLQWRMTAAFAWGNNSHGQLGDGGTATTGIPAPVVSTGALDGKTIVALASGSQHSLALCSDGTLAAWGRNNCGQLGDGTSADSNVPVDVSISGSLVGRRVVAIAAGAFHSLALCSDGTVHAWGYNFHGELGDGSSSDRNVPVAVVRSGVLSGKTVTAVAAGYGHSLALSSDGLVYSWGQNHAGQLGNGDTTNTPSPVAVTTSGALSGSQAVALAAGSYHSLALCSDGRVVAWGLNSDGQLGNGSEMANILFPVEVLRSTGLAGKTVTAVSAGSAHSLALCSDGTVAAWGSNSRGQLGDSAVSGSRVPLAVPQTGGLVEPIVSISAGNDFSVALGLFRSLLLWGRNDSGQLGNGNTVDSGVPSRIENFAGFTGLSVGPTAAHTVAVSGLPPLSDNPTLSGLSISEGTLSPAFSSSNPDYSVSVGNDISRITVCPTGTEASSAIFVNEVRLGSGATSSPIPLSVGNNTVTIRVVAPNGVASLTYTIQVTRAPSSISTLSDLSLSGTSLSPAFDPATTTYSATVSEDTASVTVTPTVAESGATVAVNGVAVLSGSASGDIPLAVGANTVAVMVTAQDGSTTSSYSLFVLRPGEISAALTGSSSIPLRAEGFVASRVRLGLSLEFAPPSGGALTIIDNTGGAFIEGRFDNLAQGQAVDLTFNGVSYHYVANYYGGTGNDLVLQWADTLAYAWGANYSFQLGDNSSTNRQIPVPVFPGGALAGKTILSVAAGGAHSLALCADGTLYAWGDNGGGALGNNSTASSAIPVPVDTSGVLAGKEIVGVAAGDSHCLALCSDGTVAAWGSNTYGQLGDGTNTLRLVPTAVLASGALSGRKVVSVAAGAEHSLALCSDGSVVSWGRNDNGQLGNAETEHSNIPVEVNRSSALSGRSAVAVAGGAHHSLAACSDGVLIAWGWNNNGQLGDRSNTNATVPVAVVNESPGLAGKKIKAIAAGYWHSVALCEDGTLVAWGGGAFGQLGTGDTASSNLPVNITSSGVLNGKSVTAVSAGFYHNLAACADGSLAAWGRGQYGQLGKSGIQSSLVPVAVDTGALEDGEKFAILGKGPLACHSLAVSAAPLSGNSKLAALSISAGSFSYGFDPSVTYYDASVANAAGELTVTAVPADGMSRVDVAGKEANPQGNTVVLEIGINEIPILVTAEDGSTTEYTLHILRREKVLATLSSATGIPITADHYTAGLKEVEISLGFSPPTGRDLILVNNSGPGFITGEFANLAQGQEIELVSNNATFRYVANYFGGTGNDLVLQWADRRIYAWGQNNSGQLGIGGYSNSGLPALVLSSGALAGKTVVATTSGTDHTIALCSDGTLAAWGRNTYGQLGNNSSTDSPVPVFVSMSGALEGKTVIAISAGKDFSVALCSDGTVVGWGLNDVGQLGNNSYIYRQVPSAVSVSGALAGKTVTAISAGWNHCLALCSDGSIVGWGSNENGKLGPESPPQAIVPVSVPAIAALSGKTVTALAAGAGHSLVLCSDGSVIGWGANYFGQLGNPGAPGAGPIPFAVDTSGALAGKTVSNIAAGNNHNLALCSDGTVAAWGYNDCGQIGNNTMAPCSVPVAISNAGVLAGKTVVAVSAGSNHSHAKCSDGTLISWGDNQFGQLANNGTASSTVPVVSSLPGGGEKLLMVSAGVSSSHSLAVMAVPLDSSLSSLTLGGVSLSPAFVPGTTAYTASVPNDMETTTVVPTVSGEGSTVTVNGQSVVSGGESLAVPLSVGENVISVAVAAQDGSNTTYSIRLTRMGLLQAGFTSASTVPVTAASYTANGTAVNLSLGFAPLTGQNLTVVNNTGSGFITGRFSNLDQGQEVDLVYHSAIYRYIANYYGGTGNDLVLHWAETKVYAWGENGAGQLGNNSTSSNGIPVAVTRTGLLAGKTVIGVSSGPSHSLALCSDGTVAAWGANDGGQLGNGNTSGSGVPVAVVGSGALAGKTVVKVSAGYYHSLALCSDGTIAAWGGNGYGQLGSNSTASNSSVPVAVSTSGVLAGKTVVGISAGYLHSLAVCSDGTVAAWGYNGEGQVGINGAKYFNIVPILVPKTGALAGKTVVGVSAGSASSLALCSDGSVAGWGANANGQLGNGGTANSSTPVALSLGGGLAGKTVVKISAGGWHCLALCSDGTLLAWGYNLDGQLGNNSTTSSTVPVQVSSTGALAGKRVVDVFAGAAHSLALCADGSAVVWGQNSSHQLGDGGVASSAVPVVLSAAALDDGERSMLLGSGSRASHSLAVAAVPLDSSLSGLNVGGVTLSPSFHSGTTAYAASVPNSTQSIAVAPSALGGGVAISVNGLPVTSGENSEPIPLAVGENTITVSVLAQDGSGTTYTITVTRAAPLPGAGYIGLVWGEMKYDARDFELPFTEIAAGKEFNLAIKTDGTVAAWGYNHYGQCNVPEGLGRVLGVAGGESHSVAVKSDGTVAVWGNTSLNRGAIPSGLNGVIAVSAGEVHTLALKADGTVVAWGAYGYDRGQTTVPADLDDAIAIAAGGMHSLALRRDGTVVAWGDSEYAQCEVPSGLSDVVAIAAGQNHSVALKSDGTVVAWGDYSGGQYDVPAGLSDVVEIAAGWSDTVAVKSDGTVVTWGHYLPTVLPSGLKDAARVAVGALHAVVLDSSGTPIPWGANYYGQCLVPEKLAGVSAISSKYWHTIALRSDGTVFGWGRGYLGQCDPPEGLAGVVAVEAAHDHSVALKADGTVVAWGDNSEGQCDVPQGLSGVTAISAGDFHTVALKNDGTVVAWGSQSNGRCEVPAGLSGVVAISANADATLALKNDGTVVGWGYSYYSVSSPPTDLVNVVAISAGRDNGVAVKNDGSVAVWGSNWSDAVTLVPGDLVARAVAAGSSHIAAINGNGEPVLWGSSHEKPSGASGLTAIAAADGYTVALQNNRRVRVVAAVPDASEYGPTPGAFAISQSGADDVSVSYQISVDGNVIENGGTSRFTVPAGPLVVSGGEATATILVTPISNDVYDGDKIVQITLLPSPGYSIGANRGASVTIRDKPVNTWRYATFGWFDKDDLGVVGDGVVHNGSGITNLLAYAVGANPYTASREDLPEAGVGHDSGKDYLIFSFTRNSEAKDLTYTVEASNDLASGGWTPLASGGDGQTLSGTGAVSESGNGTLKTVEVRDTVPIGSQPKRFIRLKVTR